VVGSPCVTVDPADLLAALVAVDPDGARWIAEQRAAAADPTSVRIAFARAARRLGDRPIEPDGGLPAHMRGGHWRVVDLGRAVLVVAVVGADDGAALVERLYRTGELGEQESLLRMLALLPAPARFTAIAAEACRTNARSVFAAIATHNPFPAAHFPEPAFNQMVLKAIFVGVPVAEVVGLTERANAELRRMALGYASERRAAGRGVPDDVARVVALCEQRGGA
jgi:hypothetical protein